MKDQKTCSCNYCSYSSDQIKELKIHKTVKHKECQECGITKPTMLSLLNHQESMHPDYKGILKVEKCKSCDFISTRKTLARHFLGVHEKCMNVKRFSCAFCTYSAVVRAHLKIHKTIVHNQCQECGETHVSKRLLMEHQESLHPDYSRSFKLKKCPNCDYINVPHNLKKHFLFLHEKTKSSIFIKSGSLMLLVVNQF